MSLSKSQLMIILFSLVYSIVLALLPIDSFQDRDNYLFYVSDSSLLIVRYLTGGVIAFLSNEPLWLIINVLLGFFLSPENALRLIIFFGAFFVSYSFLRLNFSNHFFRFNYVYFFLLVIILVSPQILKNHIIHLRQGLAIGIFLLSFVFHGRTKYVFILLTPFVHASFFFVVAIYFVSKYVDNFSLNGKKLSGLLIVFLMILFLFAINLLLPSIIELSGARQASEYDGASVEGSGFGFIVWSLFIFMFVLQSNDWIKENIFSIGLVLFYLSTYFWLPVSARIFESGMLFICISACSMSGIFRFVGSFFLLSYFTFQWMVKFNSGIFF